MTKDITPEAFYDALSLAHKLDAYLDGFKREEIHLFSFFSSLLYLYAGNTIGDWPHRYIVNNGYPYSDIIDETITRHIQNGLFEENGDFLVITGRGTDEFGKFKNLLTFKKREEFLEAACTTSLLVPYSQTLRALLSEPEMKNIESINSGSWLEGTRIYPKFKEIIEAVGVQAQDLIIPAVTWINYLNEQEKLRN